MSGVLKLNIDAARIAGYARRDLLEHLRGLSLSRFEELCALYLRVLGCAPGLHRRDPGRACVTSPPRRASRSAAPLGVVMTPASSRGPGLA
jgi:hypothetical protein